MARVTLVAFAVKEKAMSTGNLEGKLVASDFWPACENCRYFEACKVRPLHPAYPHTWHWGKETASFSEGELVLLSWVGTAAVGDPHTACTSYEVDPQYAADPLPHHQRYLALEESEKNRGSWWTRKYRGSGWMPFSLSTATGTSPGFFRTPILASARMFIVIQMNFGM